MAIEKKPKLTLGLKKKLENNSNQNGDSVQTSRPKLTLGVKKKSEVTQSQQREDFQAINEQNRIKRRSPEGSYFQNGSSAQNGEKRWLKKRVGIVSNQNQDYLRKSYSLKQTAVNVQKTQGKLEINIKINELPNRFETIKRGWHRFWVNAEGQVVEMKVRPRTWNKLLKANEEYPMWVASITGKMGHRIKDGFQLLEPAIQIYEKKINSPVDNDKSQVEN